MQREVDMQDFDDWNVGGVVNALQFIASSTAANIRERWVIMMNIAIDKLLGQC